MHLSLPFRHWLDIDRVLSINPTSRTSRFAIVVLVGVLLGLAWWLVWATGGTRGAYLHATYLPILVTAVALSIHATFAVAVLATLLMGPLMPLDVATGQPQEPASWMYRGAFFLAIGGFVNSACVALRTRAERNAELRDDLAGTYSRNLRVFANLVERRDEQTYGHCDRVARNAVAIGQRIGLNPHQLGCLYWAGLLHDLGKIGVPEHILRKPGNLTPEEFDEVKKHCELGKTILLNVSHDYAPIADGVLTHHERWDGTGYPHGLKGRDIPIFGRIVAVADVFEAVTSHRPYRDPMTLEEALAVLDEGRGSHFDPEIVDAFIDALGSEEIGHEEEDPIATQAFVNAILEPDMIGSGLIDHRPPWRRSHLN